MQLSRVVVLAAAGIVWTHTAGVAFGQGAPKLTKPQRASLEALVAAVDRAVAGEAATPSTWQAHMLRTSDGPHYVALRALVPDASAGSDPVAIYVRLATRRDELATAAPPERSAVKEWLAGLRSDPLPMQAGRSMSVPQGEMPVGGAATLSRRANEATDATSALRLMALQQERAAREKAEREARRQAELENGTGARVPEMLPFEDFDFKARPEALPAGGLDIRRGVTAGPGTYDVFVAWSPMPAKGAAPVRVVTYRLTLPAAGVAFGLSDVIVASSVARLQTPYPATEQSGHPYAIGTLDVTPATGNVLDTGGTLGLVFQVIHPAGAETGKPSVDVGFQVSRLVEGRQVPFGALQGQRYDETNLPGDFDASKGHPLFGAVRASLATFPRGRYRVVVTAVDNIAARQATAEASFDVRGTPESLLREAPTPGQAFRRDSVLSPAMLAALARTLEPSPVSDSLARALAALRAGRFAELVGSASTAPAERPIVLTLMALGLYGLGDSPRTVAAQLTQALGQGAPVAPIRVLQGAVMALSNDDKGAIAAWNDSRSGGIEDGLVAPLLLDAYLRQGDVARAAAVATAALDARPDDVAARRHLASTYIATRRFGDAVRLLDDAPARPEPDLDTDFLLVHALYADQVLNAASASGGARLQSLGLRYIESKGRHAELVREWLAVMGTVRRP